MAGLPFLVLSVIAMAAVYFANRASVPASLTPVAVALGDLSYAVYLTHPFTNIATNVVSRMIGIEGGWRLAAFIPASIIVAGTVYYFFERPLRDRFRARRQKDAPATLP